MSTTPTTPPAICLKCGHEMRYNMPSKELTDGLGAIADLVENRCDPPPAAQPTDEATLREKVLAGLDYCMDWKNQKPDAVKFACAMADARQYIIDLAARDAELARLRERVEAFEQDKERLDWLEREDPEPYYSDGKWHIPYLMAGEGGFGGGVGEATGTTVRQAIDAARAQPSK